MISIDIAARKLDLLVDSHELERRKKGWREPEPKVKGGVLARYRSSVTSASQGSVLR
jgi:dihydroxy-acid dehydratase